MPSWLRIIAWPLLLSAFAASIYISRIHQEMIDFEVYRQAAGRALGAENLYRPTDGHYQYKYLPAFALAMAPVAIVEGRAARLAWFAVSFGLLCLFVRWSAQNVPEKRLSDAVLMGFAVLFMSKFYAHELNLGQSNLLLGVTLLGALLAAESGSPVTAGALVAIGVFVKPYALILVPWLWVVAGARGVVAFGLVTTTGLLLPALVYGWRGNLDQLAGWYRTVTETSGPNLLVKENISFGTMWARWIGAGSTAAHLGLVTGGASAALVGAMVLRRRTVREPSFLEFGVLMLLIPLISPQGWEYVLLLATPAVLILVDRWREVSRLWQAITALALAGMSFTLYDLLGARLYTQMMNRNIIDICACTLVIALVHLRWKRLA